MADLQPFGPCIGAPEGWHSRPRAPAGLCLCGAALPLLKSGKAHPMRVWCSNTCRDSILPNHSWTMARAAALARNRAGERDHHCERCDTQFSTKLTHAGKLYGPSHPHAFTNAGWEVNHITPLYGLRRTWSCFNHQANLQVLCWRCHRDVTRTQRLARNEWRRFL